MLQPRVIREVPGDALFSGMTSTVKKRLAIGLVVAVLGGILLLDAMHVFDDAEYIVVPHGSHSHYVPRDRDPDVPLENFPTSPPRPNERIMPDGTVVAK